MKYKRYKKDFDYSYTLGYFLTIELLSLKPELVQTVLLHSKSENSDGANKIIDQCLKNNISYEINDKLINILSPKDNCYAIGIFNKYEENLKQDQNHIVLVNPSDSGNMGTIIRTALGFGIPQLAIIRPGVDIFDPKTIRASMGALFQLSFQYFDDFGIYHKKYHNHNMYPFMLNAKHKLYDIKLEKKKPYALIFGNEASGLDESFREVGESVIIPHLNTIDSLNLSIATGIAIYEFTKDKRY